MAFKAGDTVRCVEASGVEEWLVKGDIYTAEYDSECGYVTLRGVPGSYLINRFAVIPYGGTYTVSVEVPARDLGDFITSVIDFGYEIDFVTKEEV